MTKKRRVGAATPDGDGGECPRCGGTMDRQGPKSKCDVCGRCLLGGSRAAMVVKGRVVCPGCQTQRIGFHD